MASCDLQPRILLTGASGYIGRHLLALLKELKLNVRCVARHPDRLNRVVSEETEVVAADMLDLSSLHAALKDVDTAFYFVHSMAAAERFEEEDRKAARNFATASKQAGVRRIIYLGGLGESEPSLSPHLKSRHEVGEILRTSGCQVLEFRASIVIGAGSLSFELVRALVERLPVMVCPKWVSTLAQPIAIEDVLEYLLAGLKWGESESRIIEIGGPDQVTYGDIMREYARQRKLRRWLVSVPVLTPRLSSLWLSLVTPVQARVGRKLVESMRNPTVVTTESTTNPFSVRPRGMKEAIRRALEMEDRQMEKSESNYSSPSKVLEHSPMDGLRLVDRQEISVAASQADAFRPIRQIGGDRGWYHANPLWKLRGWIDRICGGVGLQRGRRDPDLLQVGDTIDWWRVETFESDRRLRLKAEMKLPGRAWLEFEVVPNGSGTTIRQTASYDPQGVLGRLYWYGLAPLHAMIFRGMLREIARAAECRI